MKTILKSKDVVSIFKQQKKANEELGEVNKKLVELDKQRQKLALKIQRIKDKGVKALDKTVKEQGVLDVLDYLGEINPIDDEQFEIEIHNLFNDSFSDLNALKQSLIDDKKEKKGMWADPLMFTGHNE